MIRFSAALVAVAIGVLIGGIATSKLLLVYIAIAVSAVALVVLAIGVVLKRGELFGEGQGLVPAGAGAGPVLPAHAGESQPYSRPDASVPPSAPFQGTAAGQSAVFEGTAFAGTAFAGTAFAGTAFEGTTAPVAPPAAAGSSAPHRAPDAPGRDRAADPVPPWEAQSARDQWSSSPWTGSTAADPAPDWMPGDRGVSDPVGLAGETTPFPSSTVSRTPPAPSSAGPESGSPNWFAPKARPADAVPAGPQAPAGQAPADQAPADQTPAGQAPAGQAPADEGSADEDEDWPGRYSWLDALDDEAADATDGTGAPDAGDASQVSEFPASAGRIHEPADDAPDPAAAAVPVGPDAEPEPGPARPGTAPADPEPASALADPEPASAGPEPAPAPADPEPASALAESGSAEPEPAPAEPALAPAAAEPAPAGSEPPSADTQDQRPGADQVAVLAGVPRYHRPDCVLIRFMPEDDIKRLSPEQARTGGCTPCAACQPDE